MMSAFGIEHGVELAKRDTGDRVRRHALHARAKAALHPPPVRLAPVDSSAIAALGYQRPTRRLSIEMRSRPGAPYTYKATPKQATQLRDSPSLGSHYSHEIRGKVPRKTRVTLADRARLFAAPPGKDSS